MLYEGEHISGSPYYVEVFDPSMVRVSGLEGGAVGRTLMFNGKKNISSCVCLIYYLKLYKPLVHMSVVIGILLQSTACYNWVKQQRPQLVPGWVTVSVCQFLVIVLQLRLETEVLGAALVATI